MGGKLILLPCLSGLVFSPDFSQDLLLLCCQRIEVQVVNVVGFDLVVFGPATLKLEKLLTLVPQLSRGARHSHPGGKQLASLEDGGRDVTSLPPATDNGVVDAGHALPTSAVAGGIQRRIHEWKVLVCLVVLLLARFAPDSG